MVISTKASALGRKHIAGNQMNPTSSENQLTAEEARKEELRQFVREKWKRIRELESQASPGVSSEEEGGPSKSSRFKQIQRRDSRASSVEYDPENPFDDDKKRGLDRNEAEKAKSQQRKQIAAPIKRAEKEAAAVIVSSVPTVQRRQQPATSPIRQRTSIKSSPGKVAINTASKITRSVPRPVRTETGTAKKVEERNVITSKVEFVAQKGNKVQLSTKSSSKEPLLIRSSPLEITLNEREEGHTAEDNKTTSGLDTEGQSSEPVKKVEKDTPTKRRKRRSEVPHYQPSASEVVPSLALSAETSNALAELEASLARLKARAPSSSSSKVKGRSSASKEDQAARRDDALRSRRSLSPAKELRRMELELAKTKPAGEASPPRISFLQRIEQTRDEVVSSISNVVVATRLEADPPQEKNKVGEKSKKRLSYTPTTRQQDNNGFSDESSCSIVIGDESIDEIVRQRMSSKFLHGVRVLVDVRDQDGEDASSGWVEKLRTVGAKVYTKVPSLSTSTTSSSPDAKTKQCSSSKLTHIVYKNGRPSTLHYLRSLDSDSSPPIVVGVNWILQCLQQGKKIDEMNFLVEIGKQVVFNKPRTSMTSKRAPKADQWGNEQSLAELLAKKKTIQRAPAQPSPLAKRCWNMDTSTSSNISAATG